MALFNVWREGAAMKTTVLARSASEARDLFCARHGFIDHAHYCAWCGISETDINVEVVRGRH
ncbi:hypothetical protein [Burkholderia gladioli]|uniref:hypothetical protein n=1 Tax=Burkholderia gladioli TaxID=28095 RepID=UPI00163FF9E2|nr:hypothetical protein [Burkholderia gladioli]